MKTGRSRKKSYLWGHVAEYIASAFLIMKGYKIDAIRYRTRSGEIDIIARKGDLAVFVEVKARTDRHTAVNAVGHRSQMRIRNASLQWIARQKGAHALSARYDIIAVRPWRLPDHFIDAF